MAVANSLRRLREVLPKDGNPISKGDGFSIDPRLIEIEPGFNARGAIDPDYWDRPEVVEYVRALAESYKNNPSLVPPMIVKVVDVEVNEAGDIIGGSVYVRDGECRLRGVRMAIAEGATISKLFVLEASGDEAAQAALITSTDSKLRLSVIEVAVNFGRLSTWGHSDAEIGKQHGYSAQRVAQIRGYLELPIELKRMIDRNEIAATFAAELYAEHGQKAVELAKEGMENAKKKGKTRATKSTTTQAPRMTKKLVESMRQGVTSLASRLGELSTSEDGYFTMRLSREDVEQLQALKEQLSKLEQPAEDEGATTEKDEEQQALPL